MRRKREPGIFLSFRKAPKFHCRSVPDLIIGIIRCIASSGFTHLPSKIPASSFNLQGTNLSSSAFIEHLIYSAALAVIVGMLFSRLKGSDPSWIIIAVAFVPDIDFGLQAFREIPGIALPFTVLHGDFHNIIALIFFSLVIAAAASVIIGRVP